MGAVTDGIAKSFYDTTELLKFEKEYLSDTSKAEVTDIKKKDKKEKTKWTNSMRDFRRTFAKKKRERLEDQAEQGLEEGKEEGRKAVEKEKPKMSMLGRFLNGIATVFKYLIIFGALNWLSNPQNAEKAVKVFKVLFAIGKFAFNLTKMGVGMILDGLTNVFGNYSEEGAIRRGLRGILGVVQLMGGLAVLRTAQYMIMPWKLMKDVNRLRMIFSGNAEASAESERNAQVRKSGVRDPKTGVIYSKEEIQQMRKAAEKADRKRPGAKKAFEERFGRESRFSKMRRGIGDKYKGFKGKLGGRANKVFGKLGGKVNVGMGLLGGATRIAGGLASGEKASSAIGAGVGQAAGGVLGGIAGTALLGPFLGPFAPIVGNAIGSFLGEWVGKELGPLMEPIFGPIKRYFGMVFDFWKMTLGPIIDQVKEPLGLIFQLIGRLGQFLMDGAKVLMDFTGFILGPVFNAIGGVVQFVVNNAKRLMNPASVAGGIMDALTFNLFDFDGENKKAAGGPVEMAAGGPMQFGSNADLLAATGGIYLKAIVGGLGAFGFVGNKVKSVLAPDIQKLGSAFGVSVGTGGGSAAGGVSTSVTFQATQTEKKKVENTKNLTYKKNIFDAIHDGLNKLLINGIKIFDPAQAKQLEKQRKTPQVTAPPPVDGRASTGAGSQTGNARALLNALADAEGTSQYANDGYKTQYTGKQFEGNDHPREVLGTSLRSDAAGRYQFLSTTWDEIMGGKMTPERQDEAALKLIKRRGVNIEDGLSINEIYRLGGEWASVEGGPDMKKGGGYGGQAKYSAETFMQMYQQYGGEQQLADGGKVIQDVPYINQRANKADKYGRPGDTQCYSTTMAMWVAQLTGKPMTAEDYNKVRSGYGISTEAYPQKRALADFGIDSVLETGQSWEALRKEVQAGYPVPVGFKYKGSGHWGMVVGYKDNGFVVHDPFGQLNFGGTWKKTNSAGDKTGGPGKYYFMDKNLFQNQLPDGDVWMWRAPRSIKPSKKIGDGSDVDTTTSEGNVNTTNDSGGDTEQAADTKPKTVAEMLEAFKTGLAEALGKLKTDTTVDTSTATKTNLAGESLEDLKPERVTTDPSNIMAVGRVKEDAMTKLRAIKEKSERDGLAEVYPVVQERVVIQRVTQQINTSGSSKAVYTKPSPLLTQ
jgi:muramidase (phage lysozyme)